MSISPIVGRIFALGVGIALMLPSVAHADPTTGLWPEVSIPASTSAEPSADAALVIGIDRYDALPRVPGAAENARDWEKYFLFGRKIAPERVHLLTDQNATAEAILARAKDVAAKVPSGGTLFVVFIGHGAPADGGQKGLLLGSDVRPSDASFASRSVSYDQLQSVVASGAQARTVMVLDACFSGIDPAGRTLLPNVQPVVATTLIANAKTTVISAGTAAEYAGALPGTQRPALSYLVLGALRGWGDADADGAVTATEAHEYASLVLRSLPNNHEQHPQIVGDGSEPLAKDAKEKAPDLAVIRSKLDTWRPPVEAKPEPKLRVAVRCEGEEARGSDEGLDVYLDRSPVAAVASGVIKRWSPEQNRNVVEHVEFPITGGKHHVLVRVPGCQAAEIDLEADPAHGADIEGALRDERSMLVHGPAGSPNWGRIGLGLWLPRSIGEEGYHTSLEYARGAETAYEGLQYGVSAAGIFVQPGIAFRWWSAALDIGYAVGTATRESDPNVRTPAILAATDRADASWTRVGVRVGPRLPLHYAAISLGIGTGVDAVFLKNTAPGIGHNGDLGIYFSTGLMVDAYAFCDWGLFAGVDVQGKGRDSVVDLETFTMSFQLGAAFQPNTTCKIERATRYELVQKKAAAR